MVTGPVAQVPRRGAAARWRRVPAWDGLTSVSVAPPELQAAIDLAAGAAARHAVGAEGPPPAADAPARLAWRLVHRDRDDSRLPGLLAVLRSRMVDGALRDPGGQVDVLSTAIVGQVEAAWRDAHAWDRVVACVDCLLARGVAGPAEAAAFLGLVAAVLAQEGPEGVLLLPVLPDEWYGEDLVVRGLPLPEGGRLTASVRWDDEWPRVNWLCTRAGVVVSAPCLLPGWAAEGPKGSALLIPGAA